MRELHRELIIVVEVGLHLGEDASPLLLLHWQDSINGLQALIVQLGLIPTQKENKGLVIAVVKTYLIAHVLECEGASLALGHSSDAEVEPGSIVLALHVWRCIAREPDVETVPDVASLGPGQVATAELTAEDDL